MIGTTPETNTYSKSKCGVDGIANLLPLPIQIKPYGQFSYLINELEGMGYVSGLTYQALPYDFRKASTEHYLNSKFQDIIQQMKDLTGKKISIVAHSMGNLQVLNMLWKLTSQKKDEIIQRYYAVGPPFLGSLKIVIQQLGGDDSFSFKGYGMDYETILQTVINFKSVFEMIPRKTFSKFSSTAWMKSINKRISDDNKLSDSARLGDDIVAEIFPPVSNICIKEDFKVDGRSNKCVSGMHTFDHIGTVVGEKITVDNIASMFEKYSYNPNSKILYNEFSQKYEELKNPGVDTAIIYSNLVKSHKRFTFNTNPKSFLLSKTQFYTPDSIEYSMGDGSVATTSAIVPGIKWAHEFKTKLSGSKPVSFVEVCSAQNRKNTLLDSNRKVSNNQYVGVDWECNSSKNAENCGHLPLLGDSKVLELIKNSLKDQSKSSISGNHSRKSNSDLEAYKNNCSLLNGNYFA